MNAVITSSTIVSDKVASQIDLLAGRKSATLALERIIKAIDDINVPQGRLAFSDHMFSCHITIPVEKGMVRLKAYWYFDPATQRKVLVKVHRG